MSTYLLAFESTHAALAAQSAFKKAKISFALIPTPTAISAGCGMTLRFEAAGNEAACFLVANSGAQSATAHLFRETNSKTVESIQF